MKAKKVYEFVQKKGIKAEIGNSILIKRSIIEWFETYAPDADYTIHNDLSITVEGELTVHNATKEPDNLIVTGDKFWYKNGKFHREDGPAIEFSDGSKFWYKNGEYHRKDGPAKIFSNGTRDWYQNDKLHREDGPAVIFNTGEQYWWLNGNQYTEEKYNKKINSI